MDRNQGNEGRREGGEHSANEQDRDDQGQFAGKGEGSLRGGFDQTKGGNQGQGGMSGGQGGMSGGRGFGSMDPEEQRRISQEGGDTSSEEQDRDDQGQFAGTGSRQGGSQNQGGNQGMGGNQGQGGSNR